MKKILTLLISLMLLFSFAGCQSDDMNEYPVILANYTITEKPESIVCLSDSVADILIACGYADRITARSSECTQQEISHIPVVGHKSAPDLNKLKEISPDIVFADKTISDQVYYKINGQSAKKLGVIRTASSKTLMNIPKNTKVTVKVRAYKCEQNGDKVFGKWTAAQTITTDSK